MIIGLPKRISRLCPKPPSGGGSSQKLFEYKPLSDDHWHQLQGDSDSEENCGGHRRRRPRPAAVPRGFLAVYVGPAMRRFVIPTSYLSIPAFRGLMDEIGEEFGYEHEGGIQIPCDEREFERILIRCMEEDELCKKRRAYHHRNRFYSF